MTDKTDCNCEQVLALKEEIAELEAKIEKLSNPKFDDALNDSGWELNRLLCERGTLNGFQFNELKSTLRKVIKYHARRVK